MKFYGFLLQWSLLHLGLTANPGIKVRITQEGLDSGKPFGTELLKHKLKGDVFPDWNGLMQYKAISFSYTLSELAVDNVEFPKTTVSLIPGAGFRVLFDDITATVSGVWRLNSWMFRNSGRATVIISKVHITAVVTVSRDETGHPSLSLETCYAAIGDLDIQLDEAASWIYRYFASFLKNPTLDSLNNALCPYIKDEIQRMSVEFREHPALIQIDQFAQIENSLTDSPTVYMTHIDLDLKGTVYPVGNDTDTMPPFKPASFMLPDVNDSMMYVGVSEYFFQTASLAYFTSGAFNVPVAKELSAYFRFTTDTFSSLIPMIAKRYAEPHPVIMNLVATAAPVVMLHPGRFILQFAGSMDVLVALPNSTTQSLLFTLNITANTHARLTIFEKKLLPALCLDSFHFSLARSNVGFFRVSLLENFLSYVLQNGVFQMVNGLLKKGFPLPNLDKFILMESAVKVHQGYVLISTDFKM